MSRNRITAGAATLLLSTMLFAGVAGAQTTGSDNSGHTPPHHNGGGTTTTTSTTVFEDVKGEEVTVETPMENAAPVETSNQAPAAVEAAPSGSLPFTGGDVAGLVVIGGAALGVGVLMVRRSRTAENTN